MGPKLWTLHAVVDDRLTVAAEVRGIIQRAALALDELGIDYGLCRSTKDGDPIERVWFSGGDDGAGHDT